jgi:hypothetical protein
LTCTGVCWGTCHTSEDHVAQIVLLQTLPDPSHQIIIRQEQISYRINRGPPQSVTFLHPLLISTLSVKRPMLSWCPVQLPPAWSGLPVWGSTTVIGSCSCHGMAAAACDSVCLLIQCQEHKVQKAQPFFCLCRTQHNLVQSFGPSHVAVCCSRNTRASRRRCSCSIPLAPCCTCDSPVPPLLHSVPILIQS